MIKHGFLIKFSKKISLINKISHEINQFCSKHTLQEVYIEQFGNLDESLAEALQIDINKWAPGIESKKIFITSIKIYSYCSKNH